MPEWVTIVTTCITVLGTIIVAIVGYRSTVRERESKRNKELIARAEKGEAEVDSLKEHIQDDKLGDLSKKIDTLSTELGELRALSQKNAEQTESLYKLSNANFRYSQSMSRVIMSIGTALVHADNLDKGSVSEIHEAISKHQADEAEILNQIYKVSY